MQRHYYYNNKLLQFLTHVTNGQCKMFGSNLKKILAINKHPAILFKSIKTINTFVVT